MSDKPRSKQTAKPERFPVPVPMRRQGVIDGLPTEMIVNTALRSYSPRSDFPFHVVVAVGYRPDPEAGGLPTAKELRALNSVEDVLLAAIRKSGLAHYIGQTTWNGTREFNFYTDDPEYTDERLEALASQQNRPIQYEIVEDPGWQRVEFFFDYEA